ncbi:MAG: hypothetical protein CSA22_10260 [Deltaproteobacteria bacterium]|nr:MAG: hypothetical protein CSA22_10260 [Deltaproteobacteria bacterium]
MESGTSLADIINSQIQFVKTKLPLFDKTALRIQREISKPDPDFRIMEILISSDPTLTLEVLKMANSIFFKGYEKVMTVHDAIIRMGLNEVANIVMFITQRPNFSSQDPLLNTYLNPLWPHAVCTAIGTQWLSARMGWQDIHHHTFISGLLHDVGKLFLLTVFSEIRKKPDTDFNPTPAFIEGMLASHHAAQGYQLLKYWKLPEEYAVVVRDHHKDDFDGDNLLLVATRFVNKVCRKMGIGLHKDPDLDLLLLPEARLLSMSDTTLLLLQKKLEETLSNMGSS